MEVRTIAASEREAVLDLLGEWEGESRAHFARYFAHDPTYRDDLCFVAVDGGRLVSTLQVFRKQVRLAGAVVEVAGVGNVFTTASHRERGISTRLLETALAEMPRRGFELSLLFATRLAFYGRLGWQAHPREWVYIHATEDAAAEKRYDLRPFVGTDLPAIADVYDSYCAGLVGTTLRDPAYWRGQLHTAGNLTEDFVVACAADEIVAYARATRLYDLYVMTEHAARPGHEMAVAELSRHLLTGESGMATQLGVAPAVVARLEAAGHRCERVEDVFWMWLVLDAEALSARLGLTPQEIEAPSFFARILPPGGSVYWIADRF